MGEHINTLRDMIKILNDTWQKTNSIATLSLSNEYKDINIDRNIDKGLHKCISKTTGKDGDKIRNKHIDMKEIVDKTKNKKQKKKYLMILKKSWIQTKIQTKKKLVS